MSESIESGVEEMRRQDDGSDGGMEAGDGGGGQRLKGEDGSDGGERCNRWVGRGC